MEEPLDLSHLHPGAQQIARLPAAERLRYVRADRWIGYTRAAEALDRLETLFAWPSRQRMPNLLVIGPTNNGKSMLIEKFRRAHPPAWHPDREEIPVLAVQMPSEPSVTRFYTALLAAMGAPLRPRQRVAELEQLALRLLRELGVRMLVIDELTTSWPGAAKAAANSLTWSGSWVTSCGSRSSVPAPGRPTWRSGPMTSWRTGSPRSPCPAGRPAPRPARCWPASPRRSRCTALPGSRRRRWPITC
jgi:hypothetical protein